MKIGILLTLTFKYDKPILENCFNILIVEPFYADSHKQWLDGFIKYSSHNVQKLTLPGRHWKWRMHGGAITLAVKYKELNFKPHLILCSSMLDLNIFSSLLKKEISEIPIAIFFHENQISYPWSPNDKDTNLNRDRHYGFINYSSALAADAIFFNSRYHKNSFLKSLEVFLKPFPDYQNLETMDSIALKSEVLYLGLDYQKIRKSSIINKNKIPILIWNHRWEFDKNPELFFNTLFRLKTEKVAFQLIVLGKEYASCPDIFHKAKIHLQEEILHWGFTSDYNQYVKLLQKADILPVCSNQDFFGISVVEAIYCGATPILPKRLSYPEHIMEQKFFYESEEEFYLKLKKFIADFPHLEKPNLTKINAYDWLEIIQIYDARIRELISK